MGAVIISYIAALLGGRGKQKTGGIALKKINQWIDRFAYSHPRFGIPNLMLYIVIANAATYILSMFAGSAALSFLAFDLYHVLHGELWRLVTFVLLPFTYHPISLLIMLSFYYFVGGTLEREWGTAKFTLYYLCGMVLSILSTIILSLATGYYGWSLSDAYYINLTLFLALRRCTRTLQIMFYMIIPLKRSGWRGRMLPCLRGAWFGRCATVCLPVRWPLWWHF